MLINEDGFCIRLKKSNFHSKCERCDKFKNLNVNLTLDLFDHITAKKEELFLFISECGLAIGSNHLSHSACRHLLIHGCCLADALGGPTSALLDMCHVCPIRVGQLLARRDVLVGKQGHVVEEQVAGLARKDGLDGEVGLARVVDETGDVGLAHRIHNKPARGGMMHGTNM